MFDRDRSDDDPNEQWVDVEDFTPEREPLANAQAAPEAGDVVDLDRYAARAPRYPAHDFDPNDGINNPLSRSGAGEIKRRIEAYWAARGYDVEVRLEAAEFHAAVRSARHDVRSDMLNGMPRRRAQG